MPKYKHTAVMSTQVPPPPILFTNIAYFIMLPAYAMSVFGKIC